MVSKKKVLCIGNSIALPGHCNKYEDTWIFLLKNEFPCFDFITYLRRSLTTDALVTNGGGIEGVDATPEGADCLESFKPNIVIIDLGIVDCAPRLFSAFSWENRIINRLPSLFRNYYIKFVKKTRKRSVKRAYVDPIKFKKNLNNYFDRCSNNSVEKVIALGISYPDARMIHQNPDIIDAIDQYNKIYFDFVDKHSFLEVIIPLDPSKWVKEIYEDGYHPNQLGHHIIYDKIKKSLHAFIN